MKNVTTLRDFELWTLKSCISLLLEIKNDELVLLVEMGIESNSKFFHLLKWQWKKNSVTEHRKLESATNQALKRLVASNKDNISFTISKEIYYCCCVRIIHYN